MLAPENVEVTIYSGLADLPHFNPDLNIEPFPDSFIALRQKIQQCDGLLISRPEYAHGVPGAMKNALDWLVTLVV